MKNFIFIIFIFYNFISNACDCVTYKWKAEIVNQHYLEYDLIFIGEVKENNSNKIFIINQFKGEQKHDSYIAYDASSCSFTGFDKGIYIIYADSLYNNNINVDGCSLTRSISENYERYPPPKDSTQYEILNNRVLSQNSDLDYVRNWIIELEILNKLSENDKKIKETDNQDYISKTNKYQILGLSMDFIGAILLFIFGIPNKIDKNGSINLILEQVDEKEIQIAKKYKLWSRIGLILLILGFAIQIYSLL